MFPFSPFTTFWIGLSSLVGMTRGLIGLGGLSVLAGLKVLAGLEALAFLEHRSLGQVVLLFLVSPEDTNTVF